MRPISFLGSGVIAAILLAGAVGCTSESRADPREGKDSGRGSDAGRATDAGTATDAGKGRVPILSPDAAILTPEAGARRTLPTIPVGYDAYRQWADLPSLRIGARTYMRSTYDRAGGNEGADASHFLRQDAPDRNVVLDVAGTGVLYFVRTNHWHGSPWHYEVDGQDHVVAESSTEDPTHPVAGSVFLPEAAFPSPLTATWSVTKGADLSWVPRLPLTPAVT